MAVVNGLFDSLNPMVMHTALLVIDALAQSPASFSLTTQYAFVLHRVVNFRRKAIGEYPSLEFTLRILHNLCTKDSEVVDAFFDDGFLISIMYVAVVRRPTRLQVAALTMNVRPGTFSRRVARRSPRRVGSARRSSGRWSTTRVRARPTWKC